jgi:hypothetical protein
MPRPAPFKWKWILGLVDPHRLGELAQAELGNAGALKKLGGGSAARDHATNPTRNIRSVRTRVFGAGTCVKQFPARQIKVLQECEIIK